MLTGKTGMGVQACAWCGEEFQPTGLRCHKFRAAMGNMCSSGAAGADAALPPPQKQLSVLEKLTATKVKEYITKHRVEASKSLNQIIMKFPKVRALPTFVVLLFFFWNDGMTDDTRERLFRPAIALCAPRCADVHPSLRRRFFRISSFVLVAVVAHRGVEPTFNAPTRNLPKHG